MDRPHTGLARREEALPGFRAEIVEGAIVASPVTPHHDSTIQKVWRSSPRAAVATGYLGRDTIAYGPDVVVDSSLGKLTVATVGLPVDPKARPQT